MAKILDSERKYIIETKVNEWDFKPIRMIVRWWWTKKVGRMTEGEILNMYRKLYEENRPLAWLNGGEN
jgi:hypothetical protein